MHNQIPLMIARIDARCWRRPTTQIRSLLDSSDPIYGQVIQIREEHPNQEDR
jgi:hypothetical protein